VSGSIRQCILLNAPPERVYAVFTGSAEFARMSDGAPAAIGSEAGSRFSCFAGMIEGLQVALVPCERIVQAWRVKNWPAGVFSIVRFDLSAEGAVTRIELTQSGFPPETRGHLETGWHENYWDPLRDYLG
jgi:activator of HSP90 ATPase